MTRNGWAYTGTGVVLALVVGTGLYFGGRWVERSAGAPERAERLEQVEAARAELDRAQARLAVAEGRIGLYQARSLLFEAAVDLDRRNFGIANQHLDAAAQRLAAVLTGGSDLDVETLRGLQSSIQAMDVSVATDLGAQRSRVLEFVALLDELLHGAGAVS